MPVTASIGLLFAAPLLSAVLVFCLRHELQRRLIVIANMVVMVGAALTILPAIRDAGGRIELATELLPAGLSSAIFALDLLIMGYIIRLGWQHRRPLLLALASGQLALSLWLEFGLHPVAPTVALVIDALSLVMILLISVMGPIVTIYALGYMREHEHHLHLERSRQPQFFAVLLVFLAAMNGLVLTNNISWMYFFWEVTTFCSFLLIGHDATAQAEQNAMRALWINSLGGLAFLGAVVMLQSQLHSLSITDFATLRHPAEMVYGALALLCLAAFTKSAQFPFQSWLLGAMVAPTPVSALLHSSTMVKAGAYLIVRIAPAINNSLLGGIVAVVGAFTFAAASGIAISQSNGKRVLAYSTIANLGLLVSCAGIDTHVALSAAVLLIIYHALSKGLLFMCMGTVEQGIGSRDIEDMQGLMKKMPLTTSVMVIGMMSMLLPPFGVMISKWMAIEASASLPFALALMIAGSAFTIVFWAKWIGIVLTMSYRSRIMLEKIPNTIRFALLTTLIIMLGFSATIGMVYSYFVEPYVYASKLVDSMAVAERIGGFWIFGQDAELIGGFSGTPLFIMLITLALIIVYNVARARPERVKPPYIGGELPEEDRFGVYFIGPGDEQTRITVRNYYMEGVFGEPNLTLAANAIAMALQLIMLGVVLG